jgi:hypothetical protein
MENHPEEYDAIIREHNERDAEARAAGGRPILTADDATWDRKGVNASIKRHQKKVERGESTAVVPDYVSDLVAAYEANFDPAANEAEIKRLDAEHDELTLECRKLTTERAVAKTNAKIAALEVRISELERRRKDTAGAVAALYREAEDLLLAIADARLAGRGESGERALRQRAAAVRRVVSKLECKFTATATGRGRDGNRLVSVTISPVIGEARTYEAREVLSWGCVSSRV